MRNSDSFIRFPKLFYGDSKHFDEQAEEFHGKFNVAWRAFNLNLEHKNRKQLSFGIIAQ